MMEDYREQELFFQYAFRQEFIRLEFFDIYLFNMNRLMEEDTTRVNETYKDILEAKQRAYQRRLEQELSGESIDVELLPLNIEIHHEIPEITMNSISLSIFFESFFISLYADFENSLLNLCEKLPSQLEKLTVRDIFGKGILQSIPFK